MNTQWYTMTKEELLKELNTTEQGITTKEWNKRIEKYGQNILPKKKKNKPLIIGIVVIVLVALILLGYFVIYPFVINKFSFIKK